MTSCHYIGNTR